MKTGIICQGCGVESPTSFVHFHQNIGALVVRFSKSINGNLCKRCVHRKFWSTTSTTLAIGWCGTISLILAPCFVIANTVQYLKVLGMPKVPAGATPPVVTDATLDAVWAHADEIFQRLGQKEDLVEIAREIGPRIGLTPGQVLVSTARIAQQQRLQAHLEAENNRSTGGFPVVPIEPAPAPPTAVEPLPVIPLED